MVTIGIIFEPVSDYVYAINTVMAQSYDSLEIICSLYSRLLKIVETTLDKKIVIGFHSHNNMQLAFSNAQFLIDSHIDRKLIIDASVSGMGRGAGNLNTELLVQYLKENMRSHYKITPLLNIIDENLNIFYAKNKWGYSLANYLSAIYNAHPDYAAYLVGKNTLTLENMNDIFSKMTDEKKNSFNKEYIEELYTCYMAGMTNNQTYLAEPKFI